MENELVVANDHRMTGVGAALVTHDEIGALREDIDDLALPLIPPLRSHNHNATPFGPEHLQWSPLLSQKKAPRVPHGASSDKRTPA
jgi:hypothetical protein